jgi:hypothetical protein
MNTVPGQQANRWYADKDGIIHLNGSALAIDEQGSNITIASLAAARTYTVPDLGGNGTFKLSANAPGANGLVPTPLRLTDGKTTGGAALAAAATGGAFGYAITLGTSFAIAGEVSNNSSKTDDALFEYVLPEGYIAGQNLTVTVNAAISTAGSPTYATKTVQIKCYPCTNAGVLSADAGPGTATAITVAGADVTFTITGTGLTPGQRLIFELETILHDTAGVACNTVINSVRVS